MKVGLIDIEPKIFNTALMQISHYHKARGDTVEWAAPLDYDRFDKLYCSSLFDFTDKSQVPERAICGGTGFDLITELPFEGQYDYSIYPKCDFSIVWFSRGCNRNCPWCVVPEKEGKFHLVPRRELNPKGQHVKIMDNDFFANPEWKNVILWLGQLPVDIQGIDVRTITEQQCQALNGLRRWRGKQFKIAWDNPRDVKKILDGISRLCKYVKPYKIMCYVLIGYPGYHDATDEDLSRVELLRDLGIDPFVMPFNKSDPYQRAFARWVNMKAIFKKVKWEDCRARVLKQENSGKGWKKPI